MASQRELVDLASHMEWADALVWSTTLQSGPARSDERIRGWLHHIHTVQRAFASIWGAGAAEFVDVASFADLPALAAWGREGHAGVQAFVSTATEDALGRSVVMPWAGRFAQADGAITHPTFAQTVWQLSMHSAHHRGQVNARLRELGAEPPLVDVIAWIWGGQPAAAWPRNVAAPRAPEATP